MRKFVVAAGMILFLVAPSFASQFIELSFEDVVNGSLMVVRGRMGPVSSAWDDQGEIIYSFANIEVSKYMAGFGPNVLRVREVGGTVGDYSQEAIGFPALREGEEVVMFLSDWNDGSGDMRIHAYRQGKYVSRIDRAGRERVMLDPVGQGEESPGVPDRTISVMGSADEGMDIEELQMMIRAVVRGREAPGRQER